MTVTELLLISNALDISPVYLLIDADKPFEVPDETASMQKTNIEIAQWLREPLVAALPDDYAFNDSIGPGKDTKITLAIRLHTRLRMLNRLIYTLTEDPIVEFWAPHPTDNNAVINARKKLQDIQEICLALIKKAQGQGIEVPDSIIEKVETATDPVMETLIDGSSLDN